MPQNLPQTNFPVNPEVNEVMGNTPGFIVRAGNTLLFALVAIALSVSAVISYPDVIEGIVTIYPHKTYLVRSPAAKTSISALYVQEGDSVLKGTPLVVLTYMDTLYIDTITAPASGIVFFRRHFMEQDLLDASTPIVTVQDVSGGYKVWLQTPWFGSGKIRPGQEVLISLDQFPQAEFGELTAKVISRPSADSSGNAVAEAILNRGPATVYGQHPDLSAGARGVCRIITGRKTFLSKLLR